MGVSSGRLVARRRRHRLTRGSHDVTGLWRGVLGEHCGRGLIHGWRLRVLTGALPTQRHLAELGRQFFSHCVLLGRRNWQENLGAGRAGVGDRLRGLQRCHRLSNHVVSHGVLLRSGQQGSLRRNLGLWLWLL